MASNINIGDSVMIRGSNHAFKVVGLRTVQSFNATDGVDIKREHPVTGELEPGPALWLPLEGSGLLKLGSLAAFI